MPILYVSDPFVDLTHYSPAEIIGRNCRFLQSPDGRLSPGEPRRHTDGRIVYELKQKIGPQAMNGQASGGPRDIQEVQVCLRNYKKGGQPFDNLLTIVPIAWEEGGELRYVVGFQVDRAKAFT